VSRKQLTNHHHNHHHHNHHHHNHHHQHLSDTTAQVVGIVQVRFRLRSPETGRHLPSTEQLADVPAGNLAQLPILTASLTHICQPNKQTSKQTHKQTNNNNNNNTALYLTCYIKQWHLSTSLCKLCATVSITPYTKPHTLVLQIRSPHRPTARFARLSCRPPPP